MKRLILRKVKGTRGGLSALARSIGIAPRNFSRFLHTPLLCDSEKMLGILAWLKHNA